MTDSNFEGYSLIFTGSLDDFASAVGMNYDSIMPENSKGRVYLLFEDYISKHGEKRGIIKHNIELYTGQGLRSDISYLLEDWGKLPEDSAIFAKIQVNKKDNIRVIMRDMQDMGLEITSLDFLF